MVRVIEREPCECTVSYYGRQGFWIYECSCGWECSIGFRTEREAVQRASEHEAGWSGVVASASRIADTLLKEIEREVG